MQQVRTRRSRGKLPSVLRLDRPPPPRQLLLLSFLPTQLSMREVVFAAHLVVARYVALIVRPLLPYELRQQFLYADRRNGAV